MSELYSRSTGAKVLPRLGSSTECARACRQLQHNIQDLSRQVTALVSQVQDLRGGQPLRPASAAPAQPSSALVTSDDIISDRLVSFTDIQVLPGHYAAQQGIPCCQDWMPLRPMTDSALLSSVQASALP